MLQKLKSKSSKVLFFIIAVFNLYSLSFALCVYHFSRIYKKTNIINLFPLFISFFYEYFEKQRENGKMQISNFNASSRPDEGEDFM